MGKKEWLDAYLATRSTDVKIRLENTGIAWAGFWIGLGIAIAADIFTNHRGLFR